MTVQGEIKATQDPPVLKELLGCLAAPAIKGKEARPAWKASKA